MVKILGKAHCKILAIQLRYAGRLVCGFLCYEREGYALIVGAFFPWYLNCFWGKRYMLPPQIC